MSEEMESHEVTCRAKAVIKNNAGIHCRPTAVIVKEARRFDAQITIESEDAGSADPTSAIELLSLGLDKGAHVDLEATGPDAESAVTKLAELLETEFDFPPRER